MVDEGDRVLEKETDLTENVILFVSVAVNVGDNDQDVDRISVRVFEYEADGERL